MYHDTFVYFSDEDNRQWREKHRPEQAKEKEPYVSAFQVYLNKLQAKGLFWIFRND